MVSPVSLANLKTAPPFGRGNRLPRTSAHVLRAIVRCRKLSPEMVEFLAAVVRNEKHDIAVRVRHWLF